MPTAAIVMPKVMGQREPMRPAICPASGAVTMMAAVSGRTRRPICSAE